MTPDNRQGKDIDDIRHSENEKPGMSSHLLIPVDFSDMSMLGVAFGFHLAEVLDVTPVIMHVYPQVWYNQPMDDFTGMYDTGDNEIMAAIEEHDLQKAAETQLRKLKQKIASAQKEGKLPDVKYTTLLEEGIAEDCILEYAKENRPRMVVMSTRGIHKREAELIGSVTAEVLDNCRVPVLSVPEKFETGRKENLKRILMFCTLDQYDVEGLDRMMNTFRMEDAEIWLMPIEMHADRVHERLSDLHAQLSHAWPHVGFHISDLEKHNIGPWIDDYIKERRIQLVIAPNRKTSVFTRLFRPTVAHQCLFTVEIPMLALPVGKN